jgi:hypothetical protein
MKKYIFILLIKFIFGIPLFSQVNLDSLLVAYYPFNGNAMDESGNGNNGTSIGATLVEDRFGNPSSAYNFDGINDLIEFGDVYNNVLIPFAISVWINKSQIGPSNQNIIKSDNYNYNGDNRYYGFWLTTVSGNEPIIAISYGDGGFVDPENRQTKITSIPINLNEWVHVLVNVNGPDENMTIYFNAIEITSYPSGTGGGMVHSSWTANMGKNTLPDNKEIDVYFNGKLDDVRIYNRLLSEDEVNALYQEQLNTIPELTTAPVTAITQTTATSGGNVTDDGGAPVTVRGVCWSTNPNPTTSDNFTVDGSGIGSFVSYLTGLTANTTYFMRAYATNSVGTAYGNELSFTTEEIITTPLVTTAPVTDITQTSATSGGNVIDDGGATVTVRGVCWSTNPNPTTSDYYTNDGSGIGTFVSYLTGLTENTTYYLRAYATNSAGTAYGNELSFTTGQTITTPVVNTSAVTDITENSATSGGNVTDDGGATVTVRGVCWSTNPNPTTSDFFTNDGSGVGTFISYLTGLSENTTYYVRAYATNSAGTSYGNQFSFTTEEHITKVFENSDYSQSCIKLNQNFPNPFATTTTISYSVAETCELSMTILSSLGEVLRLFDQKIHHPGDYSIEWSARENNGTLLPAGIYFYQIRSENFCETKRMIILR